MERKPCQFCGGRANGWAWYAGLGAYTMCMDCIPELTREIDDHAEWRERYPELYGGPVLSLGDEDEGCGCPPAPDSEEG